MASKRQELARWMVVYRQETGIKEVDHHDLARWLKKKGWPMPVPKDDIALLAEQLSDVARQETRKDTVTGRDYRAYHAFTVPQPDGSQLHLWVDIDEATRKQMWKSMVNKREQIVGEVLRMADDCDHWNRINPKEEPIQLPLDFTDDVEWRRNAPGEDKKSA